MNKLRSALATAAAAGLGLAALATAPVQAAAQPAFLAAAQMPPSSTSWTATQVFTGVPENGGVLCAPYKIPAQNTRYREFSTELDTNGVQVTTVARTEADAVKLVDTLRGALAGCGSLLEQQNPGLQAVSASHGKLAVEEGAWVYSLDTSDPQIGISDIHCSPSAATAAPSLSSAGARWATSRTPRWPPSAPRRRPPSTSSTDPGPPRADHTSTAARPEPGRAAVEPTCSAGGDHFLAFTSIACTLICYRRLAQWDGLLEPLTRSTEDCRPGTPAPEWGLATANRPPAVCCAAEAVSVSPAIHLR